MTIMHAPLDVNIANYASALVTADEVVEAAVPSARRGADSNLDGVEMIPVDNGGMP
jgi:hypothetical protein